jgi:hypothetical protein
MKTERRHELQTNVLADWLGRQIEAIRPYAGTIVTGVLVIVIVLIGYSIWNTWSAGSAAIAWSEFFEVTFTGNYVQSKQENVRQKALEAYRDQLRKEKNNPTYELTEGEENLVNEQLPPKVEQALRDDVIALAQKYDGTNLGMFAHMRAGDMALMAGINYLFPNAGQSRDLKQATALLDDAIRHYERALQQARRDPLLERRIRFNLARAYESRGAQPGEKQKSDLDKALSIYKELATGSDVFAAASRDQVEVLEQKDNVYSWFATTEGVAAPPTQSPFGGSLFEQFHQGVQGVPDFGPGITTDPLPTGDN